MDTHEMLSKESFMEVVRESWTVKTSFLNDEWSPQNQARGQCAVTALMIQEQFGGEIIKCDVEGESSSHFFNKLANGEAIDLTRDQFNEPVTISNEVVVSTKKILSHSGTQARYDLLRSAILQLYEIPNK